MSITVTGRNTKRKLSTPVWFVLDDQNRVILVPVHGSNTEWFKNLAKDPRIELSIDQVTMSFSATIVRDSNRVEEVLDKFRTKYGSMWSESYYATRDVYVEVPL
jgi:deazaflavin-dependent oxidoreductase (nitroreductase family)